MALDKPKKDEWVSPWAGKPRPDYPAAANSRPDMYSSASAGGMMDEAKKIGPALLEGAKTSPLGVGATLLGIGNTAANVMDVQGGPSVPQVPGINAPLTKPGAGANDGIAEETAQPQSQAPRVGENLPEDVLTVGSPYGMSGTLYANPTPPAGSGQVIYSDSKEGARAMPQGEGSGGFMRLLNPGKGPFGRTLENQAQIDQNVAAFGRAASIYRGMNDDARRKRLEGRAFGDVSLDQGLGGFLQQSANRNYARKRLSEVEQNDVSAGKVMADQQGAMADRALDYAKLTKPDFQRVSIPYGDVDPITGKQPTRDILMDPNTGQQVDPMAMQGGAIDVGASRSPTPEAIAALKESLKKAGSPEEQARIKEQFTELFDLPEGA
jgi:hypothetical protein